MLLLRLIDQISAALAWVAGVLLLALIGVMIFEVTARYLLNAPTLWAADLTYMLNGAIFMLSAAYCLHRDGHIRIDFLAEQLPKRVQHAVYGCLLLVAAPAIGALSYVAVTRALRSFQTGEVDPVSAFAPVMWPFHAAVALGMCVLTAQVVAAGARYTVTAAQQHE